VRNYFHWLFLLLFGITLIGCQDDITVNNPENSGNSLDKSTLSENQAIGDLTVEAGQVGNMIWKDLNKNGIQDAGEEGFPDVTICLYTGNGIWIGNCVKTDINGNYLIKDLPPGNYKVAMNIPDGWSLSPQNVGGDDRRDSDFGPSISNPRYSDSFELSLGEIDLSWDGGLYPITPVLGQVGNRVWKDLNKNGIQDIGEEGFPGVTIAIYGCPEIWLDKVVLTDVNGNYLFKNVPPGKYKVKMNIPDGWTLSPQNAGSNDAIDSDFMPAADNKPYTECFELSSSEIDLTWDGGLYPTTTPLALGKLGNFVWEDKDKNGVQDLDEHGINRVKVELYNCSSNATKLKETYTDENGNYLFNNLPAGDYKIKFVIPAGYTFTLKDQGGNDIKDSDADPLTGLTKCITLVAGATHLNIDAGLYHSKKVYPRSHGYWKTHSKYGPAKYDPTWKIIGEDQSFFYSEQTWYEVIVTEPRKGNVYYILAHQYIAARLNELAGTTVPTEIAEAIAEATKLFDDPACTPESIGKLKDNKPLRKELLKLSEFLEKFNNGKFDHHHDLDD
jgi:hypothetical protein